MNCTICSLPMKQIPAGISKSTGRGYPAFWVCEDRAHNQTQTKGVVSTPKPYVKPPRTTPEERESIERQVCLKAAVELATAKIEKGDDVKSPDVLRVAEAFVEWLTEKKELPETISHQEPTPRPTAERNWEEVGKVAKPEEVDLDDIPFE